MNRQTIMALFAGTVVGIAATAAAVTLAAEPKAPIPAADAPAAPVLPLDTLIADIEKKHGGRITEIELERRPWGDHYEMELTDRSFREWDIVVDAHTGKTLHEHRDLD